MVVVKDGKVLLQRQGKDAALYANMWDLPFQEVAGGDSSEWCLLFSCGARRASR